MSLSIKEFIVETHDEIKENPFWMNFDLRFIKGLIQQFRKFDKLRMTELYREFSINNPYLIMIDKCYHDVHAMMSNIQFEIDEFGEIRKYHIGTIVTVLQTYLTNYHALIDNERKGSIIGYTSNGGENLKKYKAIYDDEKKKYFAYNVIKEKERDKLKKYLESQLEKSWVDINWYHQCLQELNNGDKFIGEHWMFE